MNNNATIINDDVNFTDWPWLHWANLNPAQVALVYGELQFTWQQVNDLVNAYSKTLTEQGVREGHVIAAVSTNNLTVLWLYLAGLRLGACCVVLDPKQSREQINDQLKTLAAQFIWLSAPKSHVLEDLHHETAMKLVFTCTSEAGINNDVNDNTVCEVKWQAQRLASIVFTSGSSGKAKAVAHCGANHLYSAAGLLQSFVYTAQDSWLLSLPLFHVSGLAIVWRWLFAGGQLVLPTVDSLVEQLAQVTHASLVPTQLKRYLNELNANVDVDADKDKDKEQEQHSISLKRILLGGAVIPVALTDKAKSLGIECWSGYGMTEMASTVTAKLADSSAGVGMLLAHRSLIVCDKNIKVCGQSLGIGYYYRGALRSMTDANGWLVTGDLGETKCGDILADELFILGRNDNMFISGGENIHPEQIERILLSHPLINQALVFPCEDAEFGHRPIAVIDAIGYLSVSEMNKYLENKLIKYMRPVNYHALPASLSVTGIKLNRASVQLWVTSLSK